MKAFIPQIRIISVDHDRTVTAMQRLRKSMDRHTLQNYPIREVFCHLEAGRCGIPAGIVAIEVEGLIVWRGKELTEKLADDFSTGLPAFLEKYKQGMGFS